MALVRIDSICPTRLFDAWLLSTDRGFQVSEAAREVLESLVTNAPPRDREVEVRKARARSAERFGSTPAIRAS